MQLEISIESLLNKEKIESDRIEFKEGWNPDDIYRSICAYANDFDNQGGGYILIGVEEKDGIAVRPVKGVPENMLDQIQREMVGYNKKIIPAYSPKVSVEDVDGQKVIALWIQTGAERPYKTVDNVTSKKDKNYKIRIRYNSNSVVATPEQEKELYSLTANEPFDMLGNPKAKYEDISEVLLVEHLKATGSRLSNQVRTRGVEAILDEMQLLSGPPEMHRIRNVALMMFCEEPERFFPYTYVDIVKFPEGSIKNPNSFIEVPHIKGTVPQMIKRTLEKIQDMAIESIVDKVSGQMETVTSTSYPYNAIEEAVVNAFYHRDYQKYEPITIEIEPDCIRIINTPGLDRSISEASIKEGKRFRSRYYRNRRLGEFLHELELCEGHCTGIPTIQEELEENGSPAAIFETDADRQSVCVTIPIHPRFLKSSTETSTETSTENHKETTKKPQRNHEKNNEEIIDIKSDNQISDVEKDLLQIIENNPAVSVRKIAEDTAWTEWQIRYYTDKLKDKGILRREGATKNGRWVINRGRINGGA